MCGRSMCKLAYLAIWLNVLAAASAGRLLTTTAKALDTYHVSGVAGLSAALPCDMTPPHPGEMVYLVLWYRGDEGEPLYSYDSRQEAWNKGNRWSDKNQLGSRAYFHISSDPAELRIQDLKAGDEGIYRCRVDFKSTPTRNSLVNLTVITPPGTPHIFDSSGREITETAGPYQIGTTTTIKCISAGGNPKPRVTWWKESNLLDSSWEVGVTGEVHNNVIIGPLVRSDLGVVLSCQASNNNISVPLIRQITIDMVFPPADVAIVAPKHPLSAGKPTKLECETKGSRPESVITWWRGQTFLGKTEQHERPDGTTVSTLEWTPTSQENGQTLTCRAENTVMSTLTKKRQNEAASINDDIVEAAIEDTWKLAVHYVPIVRLTLGQKIDPTSVEEGSDIYLDCNVKSNPTYYKIVWKHNGLAIQQSLESGVILSGESLVLQGVSRDMRGNYTCTVSNTEGDAESNSLHLTIKYSPRCAHSQKISVGAILGSSLQVKCEVDAFPTTNKFSWTFNNSKETIRVSESDFTQGNLVSTLSYSTNSDRDFGHLYCSASNQMGKMAEPCIFHVIPAGPPKPPASCTILNQTTDLLQVECEPGFDGGLDQSFLLEVADVKSGSTLANVTSLTPIFTITGLNPGRDLILRIYGTNRNGRSPPATLEGFTLKVAELQIEESETQKKTTNRSTMEMSPFIAIIAGTALTLAISGLVIAVIVRAKLKQARTASISSSVCQDEADSFNSSRPSSSTVPMGGGLTSASNRHQVMSSLAPPTDDIREDDGYVSAASGLEPPSATSTDPSRRGVVGYGGYPGLEQPDLRGGCPNSNPPSGRPQQHHAQHPLLDHLQGMDHSESPLSVNGYLPTISQQAYDRAGLNITVNPNESSWTPLLHLHQESVL